jgi:hypothetical protein
MPDCDCIKAEEGFKCWCDREYDEYVKFMGGIYRISINRHSLQFEHLPYFHINNTI